MSLPKLICTSGSARCGKNTFIELSKSILNEIGIKALSLAFATELKLEINDFLIKKYGISSFTQNNEEKLIIRPHLVELGKKRREESNGNYWIDKVSRQLESCFKNYDIVMIEDCRYLNEINWIHSLDGKVVYIERSLENGKLLLPANDEEAAQDPYLRNNKDYFVSWPTEKNLDILRPYVYTTWKQIGVVK
jgi:hypothetical protein